MLRFSPKIRLGILVNLMLIKKKTCTVSLMTMHNHPNYTLAEYFWKILLLLEALKYR